LAIPANLLFVPCDLEQRQIGRHLAGAGLAIGLPTFVSILGVLQYLTAQTIDALFTFFASLPPGSEAVFPSLFQMMNSAGSISIRFVRQWHAAVLWANPGLRAGDRPTCSSIFAALAIVRFFT